MFKKLMLGYPTRTDIEKGFPIRVVQYDRQLLPSCLETLQEPEF